MIARAAHAEIFVKDLGLARAFYSDALGMLVTRQTTDALYLGCFEEEDLYSLILRKSEKRGVSHLAFKVETPEALEQLQIIAQEQNLVHCSLEPHSIEEGQGRALRIQDPSGLPLEFFHDIEQRESLRQRFDLHRGAHIMRIDHFNCQVPNVQTTAEWWSKTLGFHYSEVVLGAHPQDGLWAAWLRRKQTVHDIALMTGLGPRVHHIGFWCQDTHSILRACDILAALGLTNSIERGPGRHGVSNAFFLYLRDPEGNRIELYTGDYLITSNDNPPLRWQLNDPRRATFWGHQPPQSWFDEASEVWSIRDEQLMPLNRPTIDARPDFVT